MIQEIKKKRLREGVELIDLINTHPEMVKLNNIYNDDNTDEKNIKEKKIKKKNLVNIVMDSPFDTQRFSEYEKSV